MESSISGFHRLPIKKKLRILRDFSRLTKDEIKTLMHEGALGFKTASAMIENVVGTIQLPVGIATNFRINGKDYLIPMAIEETSVVAAASHAAKLARESGGFSASSDESVMIGQIQLMGVKNMRKAKNSVISGFGEIKNICESKDSEIVKRGGGLKSVEARDIDSHRGPILAVHLHIDVRDAMGANSVNTYCELAAPYLEKLTGGRSVLKIVSNLATKRLVRVSATWKKERIGQETIEGVLDAYAFAKADPFRAATQNKGAMNGIDAVIIATGNDWRAVESGAHAYAAIDGRYGSLTHYSKNERGDLVGTIELPIAVGTVGGATRIHPVYKIALKILNVQSARELAETAAAVGLANNFAALHAMVKEGIRKGHMKLHATNIAANAGAHSKEIDAVASVLVQEGNITVARAHEVLKDLRRRIRKRKLRRLIRKIEHKIEYVKDKKYKMKYRKRK